MIEISLTQMTPQVRLLFDPKEPAGLRGIAVLDGIQPGKVFTNNPDNPTWLIVYEKTFGTIYPGGEVSQAVFREVITNLRTENMVLLGLWPADPRWDLVPQDFDYEGRVLDFYDRIQDDRLHILINSLPAGCEFHPLDESLLNRSVNRDLHLTSYDSVATALQNLKGIFLVRGEDIFCEAIAGAEIMGIREMGVNTPEPYRRQGFAAITCAKLIQICEQQGLRTYWNCNKENTASLALARKLGYQPEHEYKLVAWYQK